MLSARETAVLDGIVAEQTYVEIAKRLGIGYETVKVYAKRLREKTGAKTKVGLVLWAKANLTEAADA